MRRNLERVWISGVLIRICIGPFQICIQKILDLGQEVLIISGTFINRKKGLVPDAEKVKQDRPPSPQDKESRNTSIGHPTSMFQLLGVLCNLWFEASLNSSLVAVAFSLNYKDPKHPNIVQLGCLY